MTSTFQDTVLDFDLNFLQQSSSNVGCESRLDRQKKAILVAKKKTIATDLLIRKYYTKKEKLEQTEVTLLASKEECKQVCIDYKNSVEKCTQLEKAIQLLQSQYADLEQNYVMSQNQVEAMKSHTKQLQVLIKENETAAEAMKIDCRLEKKNVKDFEKKISSLQKEHEEILKHLCLARDIAFGKKKLQKHHRSILQKYVSITSEKDPDSSMSEDSSDVTDFFEDSPTCPLYTVIEICPEVDEKKEVDNTIDDKAGVKQDPIQVIEDHESDYSNGVVSEDTGRGSSLAFSDLEKCVNSPDYFTADSPPAESTNLKNRKTLVDASTSPRRNHEGVHMATSPLIFDDEALLSDGTVTHSAVSNGMEYSMTDFPMSDEIVTIKEKRQLIDCATSPIRDIEKVNIATSPVVFVPISENKISESTACSSQIPEKLTNVGNKNIIPDNVNKNVDDGANDVRNHIIFEDLSSNCELEIIGKSKDEQLCLEKNNSVQLQIENNNDLEVEMILNSMRITQKLITPLPTTPVKLNKKSKRVNLETTHEKSVITENHTTCKDALHLWEENKGLQRSIADLTKEVLNIKFILKNQLLKPQSPKKSALTSSAECIHLINDASQETLTIVCDDNTETISNEEANECKTFEASENETSPMMNVQETLHNNDGHDCTQTPRYEVMNYDEVNNTSDPSPHISPETLLSPAHTENQNNVQGNNNSQPKCREKLNFFENDLGSGLEDGSVPNCRTDSVDGISRCKSTNGHIGRRKKLSRLDKFRRILAPQSKIKFKAPPIRKKRTTSKIIPVTKIHPPDTVNSEVAYEKAIQVMRELKSKKKIFKKDHFVTSNGKKVVFNNVEVSKPNRKNSEPQRELVETLCKGKNEIKQYVECLSRLNLEKHMQNVKESKVGMVDRSKCISPERTNRERTSSENTDSSPNKNIITTRSRSKRSEQGSPVHNNTSNGSPKQPTLEETDEIIKKYDRSERVRKRLKRVASDNSDDNCKRVLRSSNVRDMCRDNEVVSEKVRPNTLNNLDITNVQEKSFNEDQNQNNNRINVNNRHKTTFEIRNNISDTSEDAQDNNPSQSIICKMIEKYGRRTVKFTPKKLSEHITNEICKKLGDDIERIIKLPVEDSKAEINKLVKEIQGLNGKHFMSGFMKYLKDPVRKEELYNKVVSAPAPSMTKSEQVLLYIIKELQVSTPDTVNMILTHIEFSLFHLNKTPEFDVIESLSHFYALTCRYFRLKTRLRAFLLDAMYCLQFKVFPLIKQCLDVWMHILPLAHMGIAKSPLVTCLVYLLHFYKCEDRLNRIQEIRFILNKKYFYKMADWNEPKVLEMVKNSITELREIPLEKKMFRLSLIILAKRHGPKWCQKNIIKDILNPLIENEGTSLNTKKFCISMLGPLLKPYPKDMTVHCEIAVNQLLDRLNQNPPDDMKEAIFTSLIYMNKHNETRVTKALLSWSPKNPSEEFEQLMCDFVREKPVRVWKGILSKIML